MLGLTNVKFLTPCTKLRNITTATCNTIKQPPWPCSTLATFHYTFLYLHISISHSLLVQFHFLTGWSVYISHQILLCFLAHFFTPIPTQIHSSILLIVHDVIWIFCVIPFFQCRFFQFATVPANLQSNLSFLRSPTPAASLRTDSPLKALRRRLLHKHKAQRRGEATAADSDASHDTLR